MSNNRQMIEMFSQQLEVLWSSLDQMMASLSAEDWQQQHGPDWIFADLPYHLHYIDQTIAARPIKVGRDLPEDERVSLASFGALHAWNDSKFAERPADQTVDQSIQQMCATRNEIRETLAGLTDADLHARQFWFPFIMFRGFRPISVNLSFCAAHTWGHLEEANLRLGKSCHLPAEVRNAMIEASLPIMLVPMNATAAEQRGFKIGYTITGNGGGSWLATAVNGNWNIEQKAVSSADLVFTMSVEGYVRARHNMNPMEELMGNGTITVNDMSAMGTLAEITVPLDLTMEFPAL